MASSNFYRWYHTQGSLEWDHSSLSLTSDMTFVAEFRGAYDFTPPYDRRLLMIRVPEGVMMML